MGLNASQLAILAAIDVNEATSIAALSKRLAMDRTTLSRNRKPLEKESLIRLGAEGWKRSKTVHVTREGPTRLARATLTLGYRSDHFPQALGKTEWKRVEDDLKAITALF